MHLQLPLLHYTQVMLLFSCFEHMLFAHLIPASLTLGLNVLLAQLLGLLPSVTRVQTPRAEKEAQNPVHYALLLASRQLAHTQLLRLTGKCAKYLTRIPTTHAVQLTKLSSAAVAAACQVS